MIPCYFIIAIVVAFFAAALLGLLVEWSLIRFLYKRPLDTLLATWGLSLIMQQGFRSIFGAREVTPTLPDWLMGLFKPTSSIDIPINGVFVMGLTLLLTFGVWIFMYRSRMGLQMRATVQNRVMSGAAGINTRMVDRFTFCLGCGLDSPTVRSNPHGGNGGSAADFAARVVPPAPQTGRGSHPAR